MTRAVGSALRSGSSSKSSSRSGSCPRLAQSRPHQTQLGSEVQRLLDYRGWQGNSNCSTSADRPQSAAQPKGSRTAIRPDVDALKTAEDGRIALSEARELHRDGRDEEAVDILVEWLDQPLPESLARDMHALHQAMIALGCWLCNSLATRHLHARRVARAFGYTRTCERWLAQREVVPDGSTEIWARLQYDRALNAAELAQSSGDQVKAIAMLRECETLQAVSPSLPDPEAIHLCLAEVLMQCGRNAEAAAAAVCATDILRQPNLEDDRKVYALLFALSLEQAALARIDGPVPARALKCFTDAEAIWTEVAGGCSWATSASAGAQAIHALLMEMKSTHDSLLPRFNASGSAYDCKRRIPRSSSAPRAGGNRIMQRPQARASSAAMTRSRGAIDNGNQRPTSSLNKRFARPNDAKR